MLEAPRLGPLPLTPDTRAASLAADDGLPAPTIERGTAARANASARPAAGGAAVGLAPDRRATGAESVLQLDAALAAVTGRDDKRSQLRRGHPRHGHEVVHHDHHLIRRPGFRINTAEIGGTRPRA